MIMSVPEDVVSPGDLGIYELHFTLCHPEPRVTDKRTFLNVFTLVTFWCAVVKHKVTVRLAFVTDGYDNSYSYRPATRYHCILQWVTKSGYSLISCIHCILQCNVQLQMCILKY